MTDATTAAAKSPALAKSIRLQPAFSRSINLVRDHASLDLIRHYRPSTRSLDALRRIIQGLEPSASDRALALMGPYGTGKSAFALFVGALFAAPESALRQAALETLNAADPDLAARVRGQLSAPGGFLRVQINGLPDSLSRQLMLALASAAEQAKLPATLVKRLQAVTRAGVPMDRVLELVEAVRSAWAERGGAGVLIEIDELGKFLEYESYHPRHREIHLLQLLAEQAAAPTDSPLLLLVMLHQAFEQYGSRLGNRLRDEWQKVQGRFATLPFLEPAEQTLHLIAAALERDTPLSPEVRRQITEATARLADDSALPPGLAPSEASALFEQCYPLHPLTLLILPHLCQKVAQNERTLFSYLASREHFGLRQRLDTLVMGDWIRPWELYDYFIQNQASGVSDPFTHHRWVEVITALDRFDGNDGQDEGTKRLLKTIGLLNLIGAQRGLKASPTLLAEGLAADTAGHIAHLEAASLIQFRQFAQEYRVWQGSDFDLRAALQQALVERPVQSLADTLNQLQPLRPIVARRAAIENGTLRRYDIAFCARDRWPPSQRDSQQGDATLWFYLAEPEEHPRLVGAPATDVIAVCPFTERLREVVGDWLALQELPRHHAALHQDPVAQREHQSWLAHAETEAAVLIQTLVEAPEALIWWFGEQPQRVRDRRELQQRLSGWMDAVYHQAPLLNNELINRDAPSPSAVSGRKRLLMAMLSASDQDDLGIEKAPAEKSLYLSLLQETNLHRRVDERLGFFPPTSLDPCQIRPLWNAISDALGQDGEQQVQLPALYAQLQAPPFGVRLGVLPILLITYLLAHRREVALYQEGAFCANLSLDQAELLCRRPKLFALERYSLSGLRGELFDRYLSAFVNRIGDDPSLLDIVRPLVRFIARLPEYVLQSTDVSASARKIAKLFRQAKRPGALLFEDLPRACDIRPEDFATNDPAIVETFLQRLIQHLRELEDAYPALLVAWRQRLVSTLLDGADRTLSEVRQGLAERYQGLERFTPNMSPVAAFVRRLCETGVRTDEAWLESVMTLLGGAPPSKWEDSSSLKACAQLAAFASQIEDLQRLRAAMPTAEDVPPTDLVMVKLIDPYRGEISHALRLSEHQDHEVADQTKRLTSELDALDEQTRLAIIARLLQSWSDQHHEDRTDHG
ncbi:hypothetical protein U5801_20495 [Lamprobacter modestohalophilus]|uniref:hypothetical protein n=1 Tax=Lamprobacter modestohalophilus TaxID=1064514 RepID=UPI002ADEC2AC|nr:hypothetical protein [Lamprobacter modestohalophilus]MEA1052168.1 hypothetical protein [Lamprobacter modestohalophilus]